MPKRRPNILFVFPDQWRADAMSFLGHPTALTPYVDGLAEKGTAFTRAFSNCPVCIPARACMIAGQTPNAVGRFGYADGVSFEPYQKSLALVLRDAGYQTMLAGKTHFYPRRLHLGFEQMRFAEQCQSPLGSWQCIVDARMKYVWLTETGEELLFDLESDPEERRNLASDPALRELLIRRRADLAEALAGREEGMSDGTKLIPGRAPPIARDWLLNWQGEPR